MSPTTWYIIVVGLFLVFVSNPFNKSLVKSPASHSDPSIMQPDTSASMNATQWKYYNRMKRLEQKKAHLECHQKVITQHLIDGITPSGLCIKLQPNISIPSKQFYTRWNNTLQKAQRTCIAFLIADHRRSTKSDSKGT